MQTSATSAPTTNKKGEVKPSARLAKRGSKPAGYAGLPGTAGYGKIDPSQDPDEVG